MVAQSCGTQHTKPDQTVPDGTDALERPTGSPKSPKAPYSILSCSTESPEYLTVLDLVELLRVSRNTVYRMLERGEIPHVHTGRKSIRVRREAFEAWLRDQEEASKKKAPSPRKVEAFDPSKGSNRAIVQA